MEGNNTVGMFVGQIALWVFIHTLAITKKDVCNAYLTKKGGLCMILEYIQAVRHYWKNEKKRKI